MQDLGAQKKDRRKNHTSLYLVCVLVPFFVTFLVIYVPVIVAQVITYDTSATSYFLYSLVNELSSFLRVGLPCNELILARVLDLVRVLEVQFDITSSGTIFSHILI